MIKVVRIFYWCHRTKDCKILKIIITQIHTYPLLLMLWPRSPVKTALSGASTGLNTVNVSCLHVYWHVSTATAD
jgi:hypothetical protein